MHGKCPKGADLASRVPPSTPPDGKTSGCHQQIFFSPIPLSASQCHIYFPVFAIRALCIEQTFRPVYAWGKIYPAVFHTEWLFIYILAFSTSAELEMAMSSGPLCYRSQYFPRSGNTAIAVVENQIESIWELLDSQHCLILEAGKKAWEIGIKHFFRIIMMNGPHQSRSKHPLVSMSVLLPRKLQSWLSRSLAVIPRKVPEPLCASISPSSMRLIMLTFWWCCN